MRRTMTRALRPPLLLLLLCASTALWSLAVWGQAWPSAMPLLQRSHPLMQDLRGWWRLLPGRGPGNTFPELIARNDATLPSAAFAAGYGWQVLGRRGGTWQLAFDANGTLNV